MGLLKKKASGVVMADAPEEPETEEELKHMEKLNEVEESKVVEVPVCMSQVQINNIVIENNMMLKHIISLLEK